MSADAGTAVYPSRAGTTAVYATKHYANLTNGLDCPHLDVIPEWGYTRIQSTHCEAKRWDLVLYGAGPDMLMHMARGHTIVVHDKSERERETRAMWQGLTFVRLAAQRAWNAGPLPLTHSITRGGDSLFYYLYDQYNKLDKSAQRYIQYYKKFVSTETLRVESCYEPPNPCVGHRDFTQPSARVVSVESERWVDSVAGQ